MSESIGLGDVVSLSMSPGYNVGTVCQVHRDGTVDVFRPYTHTADFSMAGSEEGSSGVICYVGTDIVRHINTDRLTLLHKCPKPR